MERTFRDTFFPILHAETINAFPSLASDNTAKTALVHRAIVLLNASIDQDSGVRFQTVLSDLTSTLLSELVRANTPDVPLSSIDAWKVTLAKEARDVFIKTRSTYVPGSAAALLGRTKALYLYVRNELGAKLHWGDPSLDSTPISTEISKIYSAFQTERMNEVMAGILGKDRCRQPPL
jgi:phenylalanine ammonia-lyase